MLGSAATLFAQFIAGYTGSSVDRRGRGIQDQAVWPLLELQDLLDEWIIAAWQNRPHDGLRDPVHPGRMFTPNEKYAALIEAAGYVPVALGAEDYIELLPATWRAINAYGVKMKYRTYDAPELGPLRRARSGVKDRKDLWEVHYDPYDVTRIWVRDHWRGGWITLYWNQLHRAAMPFGDLAWDHVRGGLPQATEEELADAVGALLTRAARGPDPVAGPDPALTKRERRVAARTRAAGPAAPIPDTAPAPDPDPDDGDPPVARQVVPMPIFDPFAEAERRW
jgi:hypothetical protein